MNLKEFKKQIKNPPKKRRKIDDFIIDNYGLKITENISVYYDEKLLLYNIKDTTDNFNKIECEYFKNGTLERD